jgi:hypothetical protein
MSSTQQIILQTIIDFWLVCSAGLILAMIINTVKGDK